jgi:hypothetical protein
MSKFNNLKTGSNSINISRQPQFFFFKGTGVGEDWVLRSLEIKKKKKKKRPKAARLIEPFSLHAPKYTAARK